MIVNFRQGIVSYPAGFLTKVGTPTGSRVALNIATDKPLILHFAHGNANYVVVQRTSVGLTPPTGAFGPFIAGEDYWLYADINLTTGVVTWSSTTLEPVNQATTPSATQTIISDAFPGGELVQQAGRHWFKTAPVGGAEDITYPPYTMFVRNTGNTAWEPRVRVFLAKYEESSFFISVSINSSNPNTAIKFGGTQVGNLTENNAGFLIYDSSNVAYKNSDGTFVTTEDVIKTGMLLGADLKVGNNVVTATAAAPLAGYTVVRFTDFGRVAPVNLFNLDQSFFGFVEDAALLNETVQVILEGIVTNSAWNWSAPNVPIYADNTGLLTETRPSINDANPVAFSLTATSVVLRPSRVEVGLVDHASDTEFGSVKLDAAPPAVEGYIDVTYSPTVGADGTGTGSSGLFTTNTYTARLVIDGTQVDVVYGPSDMPGFPTPTVPTVQNVIDFLNNTAAGAGGLMGAATVSLASTTTLRIMSDNAGPLSSVRLTSGSAVLPNLDLFENIDNFSNIEVPVDGYYDSIAAAASSLAAHIADMDVHLSTEQNTLLDLLDAATPGIVVKNAEGSMASRSVTSSGSTLTVTNGDGVAGNINIDMPATGVGAASYGSSSQVAAFTVDLQGRLTNAVNVSIDHDVLTNFVANEHINHSAVTVTGTGALTGGGDLTSNRTLNMAALPDSGTGSFLKLTRDGYGRVSGTTAVVAADITGLVDATYVNVIGDTMTGALAMSSNKITGLANGTVSGDALHFGQIGAQVQAWDTDLDALAGLATTGIVVRTGAGTATTRSVTSTGSTVTVTNGDGVSGNINLEVVEPLNQIVYGTGTGIDSDADLTWDPSTHMLQLGTVATPATIRSPNGSTSAGANLNVTAGNGAGTDQNGGDVTITAGDATGAGVNGNIVLTTQQTGTGGGGKVNAEKMGKVGEFLTTANVATNYAINLNNGNAFDLTMTASTTFTFTNPYTSGTMHSFTVVLRQDGFGGWTATLPTVLWAGGTPPTLSTSPNEIDILTFMTVDGGTTWFGFPGGLNFS